MIVDGRDEGEGNNGKNFTTFTACMNEITDN